MLNPVVVEIRKILEANKISFQENLHIDYVIRRELN